jgi:hypothetical protein
MTPQSAQHWGIDPHSKAPATTIDFRAINRERQTTGLICTASGAGAMIVSDMLDAQRLVDFLKGQGVINANDQGLASPANKISSNGRHITGCTFVDGFSGSFKLTLDQLCVCRDGRTRQVGYPGGVASQLTNAPGADHQ